MATFRLKNHNDFEKLSPAAQQRLREAGLEPGGPEKDNGKYKMHPLIRAGLVFIITLWIGLIGSCYLVSSMMKHV